jgi:3-deoxy-manno-octulosonate cytidylyltransferase (CMP-KDO synthetase)
MIAVAILPARYASTRLAGKPLADLCGKPMIRRVHERVAGSGLFADVIVATDDDRIAACVRGFGGKVAMTSPDHPSGTDRVAEAAKAVDADVIVNVQGDEPLLPRSVLAAVLAPFARDPRPPMTTVATRFRDLSEFLNPNQGKVVVDKDFRALYFSRSPIPFAVGAGRDGHGGTVPDAAYKTIGIYGYRKDFLATFAGLPPTPLERAERLEQLRALEHGFEIVVGFSEEGTIGVDTPEDLERVRAVLAREGNA